jgi:hypothetical protein
LAILEQPAKIQKIKTRQAKPRQAKPGQIEVAGQAGQGKARQGKASQGKATQAKPSLHGDETTNKGTTFPQNLSSTPYLQDIKLPVVALRIYMWPVTEVLS